MAAQSPEIPTDSNVDREREDLRRQQVGDATRSYWISIEEFANANLSSWESTLSNANDLGDSKLKIFAALFGSQRNELRRFKDRVLALPTDDVDPLVIAHVAKRLEAISPAQIALSEISLTYIQMDKLKSSSESFSTNFSILLEAALNDANSNTADRMNSERKELLDSVKTSMSDMQSAKQTEDSLILAESVLRQRMAEGYGHKLPPIPRLIDPTITTP